MNKALILTGAGAGGTVISVGGAYISGAFDGSNTKENNNIQPVNLKIPGDLAAFKEKGGEAKPIKDHFSQIDWSNKGNTWDNSSDVSFLNSVEGGGANLTSKLTVNWEKYGCNGGETGKWSGKIQWLWSIANASDGIIFYAEAESSSKGDDTLDVKGTVYVTEKEDDKWKIKYNKDSEITSPISNWDGHLPKVGTQFQSKLKVKNYWGFIDDGQLTGSCKSSSRKEQTPTSKFMGSWTWKYETPQASAAPSENKILAWSEGGMGWLCKFYGSTMMDKFKNNLDEVWTGTWSKGEDFDNENLGVNTDTSAEE